MNGGKRGPVKMVQSYKYMKETSVMQKVYNQKEVVKTCHRIRGVFMGERMNGMDPHPEGRKKLTQSLNFS